ncbi:hypothetical protein B0T10DRAFT_461475 [Thelonectria olida]|uniref:Uncharacterized protein n=1 Tax=Thelonectria olida TaxID=1576542 RepID=A0A9P8W196_9HYPO|nr:hypothetical protein B0T10DRAFT_461475 [Thelonectria olida]
MLYCLLCSALSLLLQTLLFQRVIRPCQTKEERLVEMTKSLEKSVGQENSRQNKHNRHKQATSAALKWSIFDQLNAPNSAYSTYPISPYLKRLTRTADSSLKESDTPPLAGVLIGRDVLIRKC